MGLVGTAGEIPVIPTELAEGGKTADFLRAEHGFSALIEVQAGGGRRRVLFDAGITPDGLIGNLDRLAISPDTFEAVVLSHGHFDHVMGLDGLARRLGPRNLPLLLHPDFWTRRRIVTPGGGAWELPMPSRSGIQGAGFAIIEDRQPSFLLDGILLVTGEVDRTTEFETGMPIHQAWRGGDWVPDPLIHDDQAVVLHVRDKGLVVLTGCGHSGIVNIVRHAKALTGVNQVYAVMGGPPHRRDLREDHPADRRRPGQREPRRARPGPLHRMESTARLRQRTPRRLPAQLGRQPLRTVTCWSHRVTCWGRLWHGFHRDPDICSKTVITASTNRGQVSECADLQPAARAELGESGAPTMSSRLVARPNRRSCLRGREGGSAT